MVDGPRAHTMDLMNPATVYYCKGRLKPALRGQLHRAAALSFPVWAGYQLSLCTTMPAVLSALLSLFGALSMLGLSATYHCGEWATTIEEDYWGQMDYIGIFLQVAFSGVPLYVLLLPTASGLAVVGLLATTVCLGVWLILRPPAWLSRKALVWVYVATAAIQVLPLTTRLLSDESVYEQLLPIEKQLILLMAALYLFGSQCYAYQKPRLWPLTFGFHELWHLLVVVASASSWACNCSLLARQPGGSHSFAAIW